MRLSFGSRVLNQIASCGFVLLVMMSAMSNTAAAETPDDIAYEWADFLSLLPVDDQVIWDSPEYFEFWLATDADASIAFDYAAWGGMTLEEISDIYYPDEEDSILTLEEIDAIYNEVYDEGESILTLEEVNDIFYPDEEGSILTLEELNDIYYEDEIDYGDDNDSI